MRGTSGGRSDCGEAGKGPTPLEGFPAASFGRRPSSGEGHERKTADLIPPLLAGKSLFAIPLPGGLLRRSAPLCAPESESPCSRSRLQADQQETQHRPQTHTRRIPVRPASSAWDDSCLRALGVFLRPSCSLCRPETAGERSGERAEKGQASWSLSLELTRKAVRQP